MEVKAEMERLLPEIMPEMQRSISEYFSTNSWFGEETMGSKNPVSKEELHVTKVFGPLRFYARTRKDQENLLEVSNTLESCCKAAVPLSTTPEQDKVYGAQFSENNCWYRGQVVGIRPFDKSVLVRFIDYGNQEAKSWSDLVELPSSLISAPPCTRIYVLKNVFTTFAKCTPEYYQCRDQLSKLINAKTVMAEIYPPVPDKDITLVTLTLEDCSDVIDLMVGTGFCERRGATAKPTKTHSNAALLQKVQNAGLINSDTTFYLKQGHRPPANQASNQSQGQKPSYQHPRNQTNAAPFSGPHGAQKQYGHDSRPNEGPSNRPSSNPNMRPGNYPNSRPNNYANSRPCSYPNNRPNNQGPHPLERINSPPGDGKAIGSQGGHGGHNIRSPITQNSVNNSPSRPKPPSSLQGHNTHGTLTSNVENFFTTAQECKSSAQVNSSGDAKVASGDPKVTSGGPNIGAGDCNVGYEDFGASFKGFEDQKTEEQMKEKDEKIQELELENADLRRRLLVLDYEKRKSLKELENFNKQVESLSAGIDKVRVLRQRLPSDCADDDPLEATILFATDAHSRMDKPLGTTCSVHTSLTKYKETQKVLREAKDQDADWWKSMTSSRDEARRDLHATLTEFLKTVDLLPLSERYDAVQREITALESNHASLLSRPSKGELKIDELMQTYIDWRINKQASYQPVRQMTNTQHRKMNLALAALQKRISLGPAIADKASSLKHPNVADRLRALAEAVRQEVKVTDLESHDEAVGFLAEVVHTVVTSLRKELRSIEQLRTLTAHNRKLKEAISEYLTKSPDLTQLKDVRAKIKALRSSLRHALADLCDAEEDDESDGSEGGVRVLQESVTGLRGELQQLITKQQTILGELATVATQHFPELLSSLPDLSLHLASSGLLQTSRAIDHYDVTKSITSQVTWSQCQNGPVVIKDFVLGVPGGVAREEFSSRVYAYHKVKCPSLRPLHALFFSKDEKNAYLLMEAYDQNLYEYVTQNAPVSVEFMEQVLLDLSTALKALHCNGLVHGSVHPRNVLLNSSLNPILAEYDLGKTPVQRARNPCILNGLCFSDVSTQISDVMSVLSDVNSVTDPQGEGKTEGSGGIEVDGFAGDVYCLGLLLLWMRESHAQLPPLEIASHNEDPGLRYADVIEKLPVRFRALVLRLLCTRPNERPTVAELQSSLATLHEDLEETEIDLEKREAGSVKGTCHSAQENGQTGVKMETSPEAPAANREASLAALNSKAETCPAGSEHIGTSEDTSADTEKRFVVLSDASLSGDNEKREKCSDDVIECAHHMTQSEIPIKDNVEKAKVDGSHAREVSELETSSIGKPEDIGMQKASEKLGVSGTEQSVDGEFVLSSSAPSNASKVQLITDAESQGKVLEGENCKRPSTNVQSVPENDAQHSTSNNSDCERKSIDPTTSNDVSQKNEVITYDVTADNDVKIKSDVVDNDVTVENDIANDFGDGTKRNESNCVTDESKEDRTPVTGMECLGLGHEFENEITEQDSREHCTDEITEQDSREHCTDEITEQNSREHCTDEITEQDSREHCTDEITEQDSREHCTDEITEQDSREHCTDEDEDQNKNNKEENEHDHDRLLLDELEQNGDADISDNEDEFGNNSTDCKNKVTYEIDDHICDKPSLKSDAPSFDAYEEASYEINGDFNDNMSDNDCNNAESNNAEFCATNGDFDSDASQLVVANCGAKSGDLKTETIHTSGEHTKASGAEKCSGKQETGNYTDPIEEAVAKAMAEYFGPEELSASFGALPISK